MSNPCVVKIGVSLSQGISEHPWEKIHRLFCYQITATKMANILWAEIIIRGHRPLCEGIQRLYFREHREFDIQFFKAGHLVSMESLWALKRLFWSVLLSWRWGGFDLKNREQNAMHTSCGEHWNSHLTQPVYIFGCSYLNNNRLTGPIPNGIGNLKQLTHLWVSLVW